MKRTLEPGRGRGPGDVGLSFLVAVLAVSGATVFGVKVAWWCWRVF